MTMTQNDTWGRPEGGLKVANECHVIFEWPLKTDWSLNLVVEYGEIITLCNITSNFDYS